MNLTSAFVLVTLLVIFHQQDSVHGAFSEKNMTDSALLTKRIGTNRVITVDANGEGDFKSVQAAVDLVPDGNSNWIAIHLRKGVYREKFRIPANNRVGNFNPNSENSPRTRPVWGAIFRVRGGSGAAKTCPGRSGRGTGPVSNPPHWTRSGRGRTSIASSHISTKDYDSATLKVEAPHFVAFGISFKGNVYGIGRDVYLGRAKGAHSRVVFANTYLSRSINHHGWTNWRYSGTTEEKELAAVKINAADVDIIANELELDKKVAERTLREHKGDAVAAIRSLLY
ncbi:putative pectinesterase 67 [Sesamum angolense]|uniref:Pectinesterase 67 n=1 Tax=Sesamum angolense TaxID=2727404 RepID=A0AAE1X650_9LAMI|nr:putative pectinesterase 67 [Sesamum angolense]